eukprot:jgi/Bigna1/77703/fgenesh1_pg.49_\
MKLIRSSEGLLGVAKYRCQHVRGFAKMKQPESVISMGKRGGKVPAAAWLEQGLTRTATPKGKLTTGIHKLNMDNWLLYDPEEAKDILKLKGEMLSDVETRPSVYQCAEDSPAPQLERVTYKSFDKPLQTRIRKGKRPSSPSQVLEMICSYLPKRFPESFEEANGVVTALSTGERLDLKQWRAKVEEQQSASSERALEAVSRLVQEDFVLVSSFGRLRERFNFDLREIHSKVHGYESDLHNPVTRFFNGLTPDKPCWRTNWAFTWHPSLKPHPERYPHRNAYAAGSKDRDSAEYMMRKMEEKGVGDAIWLKVEYQTFRRLEKNPDCVLFSIRTFVDPLTTLETMPEAANNLASARDDSFCFDLRYLAANISAVEKSLIPVDVCGKFVYLDV